MDHNVLPAPPDTHKVINSEGVEPERATTACSARSATEQAPDIGDSMFACLLLLNTLSAYLACYAGKEDWNKPGPYWPYAE